MHPFPNRNDVPTDAPPVVPGRIRDARRLSAGSGAQTPSAAPAGARRAIPANHAAIPRPDAVPSRAVAVLCALFVASVTALASCAGIGSGNGTAPDPAKAVYSLAPVGRESASPREGAYYCVFVRSFADGDGDGVGDFKGLTAKLDYLNDGDDRTVTDLGVTGIWLMPIYPSGSYHGYDVDDYYGVNPQYGTMADFEAFMAAAKERGISVILDLTCNHSSARNPWFIESTDPASPYRDWYRWIDAGDEGYNLKQTIWGHKLWNGYGGSYYSGLFDSGMPDFNLSTPAVREEFRKVAKFWMDKGVSGFRFDAAGHVFNAAKLKAGESSQERAVAFWEDYAGYIRTVNPDAYTVGEVWEPTFTRAAYMEGLGSDFHFDLGTKIVEAIREGSGGKNNLANSLAADYAAYAKVNPDYIDAPFLTNHDQNRVAGLLKGEPAKLKLAASIYMLAEGVPFVYYGEEIGMMGAKPDEQIRTPFLWNVPGKDRLQTAWIESKYNKNTVPAALQAKDGDSLLSHYKRLIRVKTSHPALYAGRLAAVAVENSAVVSWAMNAPGERAFVLHNLSSETVTVALPEGQRMPIAFATYEGTAVDEAGTITIPPLGSAVLAEEH